MEATVSTGTGDVTLGGAVNGFQTFDDACAASDVGDYVIFAVDSNGTPTGDWEAGEFTYAGAGVLERTTVRASSAGGSPVSFPVGSKYVMLSHNATSIGPETHTPSYQNSWVEFGGALRVADVSKLNGVVTINLTVKNGGNTTAVFTLPVGWRPSADVHFIIDGGAAFATCDIHSDGTVTVSGASVSTYASIAAVFRVL